MTNRARQASPQTYARIGGLLYVIVILGASFGELFVRNRLIVWGDPDATAGNILGSEMLFRVGLAGEMVTIVCDVALALILYVLLKPVSKHVALLGAFFRLTFDAIYAVTKLFEIAALVALDGALGSLKVLDPGQLHDLAYISLRVHSLGYGASLLFFGFCCVLFGHLIHRSGYLPRIIGILLATAGYGYVVFSIGQMLAPAFAGRLLFPPIILLAFVAETGLALWLLLKGVDVEKWDERRRSAGEDA
jgi:hypothetical protein